MATSRTVPFASIASDTPAQHVIESLVLSGGYLRGTRFEFSPRLNCIIGGRGSGKTTMLELLLFALGVPVQPARAASFDALVKSNLGNGRATVRVRNKHGVRYESGRAYGEAPRVVSSTGELAGVSLDGELFKVDYYTPNQIERIALDPIAQLALIDKFAESDVRRIDGVIGERARRLAQNATDVTRLEREIQDDEEKARELPTVRESLQALQQVSGPDAAEAKNAFERRALRTRERAALTSVTETLTQVRADLDAFVINARHRLSTAIDADLEKGPNGATFTALTRELLQVDGAIEDGASRARAQVKNAEKVAADHDRMIAALHAKQDDAYRAIVERQNEDRGRVAERDRLQKRFVELSAVAKRLAETQRECAQRREERRSLAADLRRLCDERFTLRETVTKELTAALDGEIRVSITRAGNFAAYEALLADLLRGANIRPASFVKEIARSIKPHDLCALVLREDVAPLVAIDDTKTGKIERARTASSTRSETAAACTSSRRSWSTTRRSSSFASAPSISHPPRSPRDRAAHASCRSCFSAPRVRSSLTSPRTTSTTRSSTTSS